MCGFTAIYHQGKLSQDGPGIINAMTDAIAHRGPDADGFFHDNDICLGHRRLSILDLSENGAQPMFSSDKRFVIVFNGEIYNYLELNDLLKTKGFVPRSHCDTETIINLYAVFGESCLDYLRGMFAFIIWDRQEKKLFAARDRFGIKPLYYAQTSKGVVFGSELKAIIKSGIVEKQFNPTAIELLFETGSVMQPETILKGVFHLQPGHAISIKNGNFSQWQYWNIPFNTNGAAKNPIGYEEAKEQLRELFFDALKHHLISDVPLGVFLSGGIDSSLIVAAMQKMGGETKTYSMGFDVGGSSYNETHHAKRVAEMYGTSHTEVILSESDILSDIDKIIYGIDQPSSDGLNTYIISKISRPHVTVALSGLGSDELFGGYTLFKFAQRLSSFHTITNKLPEAVGELGLLLEKKLPSSLQETWHWRALAGIAGSYSDTATLYSLRNLTSLRQRKQLFNKSFINADGGSSTQYSQLLRQVFPAVRKADTIQELSFLELKCYMNNTLLRDSDAMSMINSLEVRVPFLDHKLAEFVTRLPASYKIDNATKETGKKILIDTFSDLLPGEIVHRKKMGFVFPLGIWMRTGKFRTLIEDTLTEKAVRERGVFNYSELQKNMTSFFNSEDNSPRTYRSYLMIWLAAQLELWAQMLL